MLERAKLRVVIKKMTAYQLRAYSGLACLSLKLQYEHTCIAGVLHEVLKSHNDNKIPELCDTALQLLEKHLPSTGLTTSEDRACLVQLQSAGVSLWNKAVALKSAGAVSLQLNAQSMNQL